MRLKWAIAGALVAVAVLFTVCYLTRRPLAKAEAKLERTYTADTTHYAIDTAATNRALDADSAKPATKAAVKAERKSAGKALATSDKKNRNLTKQLSGGWLRLFGEADYAIPDAQPLLEGTLAARVGVELRVRQSTYLRGYVDQAIFGTGRRSYHVGVRQEVRLF